MLYRIEVWISLGREKVQAGELVCEVAAGGAAKGAFRYDAGYLKDSRAFPLDPISLPLGQEVFSVDHPGIHGVFEDSLPDAWGRRLLVRKHRTPRHEQNLPNLLLALGSGGLGALSYSAQGKPKPSRLEASIIHLEQLVRAAELFERGEESDADIFILLSAGSSPGGGRPKALVFDAEMGKHYLAKFPSISDRVNVVAIEAATMRLAEKAGLMAASTRLVHCGLRPVLLVERFDLHPLGRRHMISLQTLLKASGYYVCRYVEVLAAVRKISGAPLTDSSLLFRQMVFNAVIGNTDDHLKNFWMVHGTEEEWRLSPSFDLLPDVGQNGEHTLFFDLDPYYPGRKNLERLGRSWGIPQAERIVEEVFAAVAGWKEAYASFGVPEGDIVRFRDMDERLRS